MADYIDDDNLWKEDLFATLGVPKDVSEGQLKKAYLKLAKKYHPDKYLEDNEEKLEAQRLFSKITVAYNTLSDPNKKKHYLELRRLLASHLPDEQQEQVAETVNEGTAPAPNAPPPSPSPPPVSSPPKPKVNEAPIAEKVKEDQAFSFYNLGLDQMKKKKFDKAIDYFKQAIGIKKDIAKFHSQLGLAYQEKNWEGMAQAEFILALKYDPQDRIAKKNAKDVPKNVKAKSAPKNSKSAKKKGEKKGGFFASLFGKKK